MAKVKVTMDYDTNGVRYYRLEKKKGRSEEHTSELQSQR